MSLVTGFQTRFGDVEGLGRAAGDLDHLARRCEQHHRAVAGAVAGLTGTRQWGGHAADGFDLRALTVEEHLAASARTASTAAGVLRRLAAELTVAEELAARAERMALAAADLTGAATVPAGVPGAAADLGRCPVPVRSIASPGAPELRHGATAGMQEARAVAERAWRAAAAGLQEVWAWALDGLQAFGAATDVGGAVFAIGSAAQRRAEVATYWQDVAREARASARSGITGQALDDASSSRALATVRQQANAHSAARAPGWARRGPYASTARILDSSVDLGRDLGVLRGAPSVPLLGAVAAGAGTVADIEEGVEPARAVTANAAALLASTAVVALATGPGMPVVLTAVAIGVVGYGVGNLVHGWIAHGDPWRDFKEDFQGAKNSARWVGDKSAHAARAVGRFLKGSPLW